MHRKWPRITVSPRIVARGRSAYHRHKMATRLKFLGNARNVRRWSADIRRKQVTDDHNPHETPFSSNIWSPSRPSGPQASLPAHSPRSSHRVQAGSTVQFEDGISIGPFFKPVAVIVPVNPLRAAAIEATVCGPSSAA